MGLCVYVSSILPHGRYTINKTYIRTKDRGTMSLVPPMLIPSSLYKEEAKRDATRIKIYNSVLQQIFTKIKAIARIPGNEKTLWYLVPEFIPGVARFDAGDAILYIVWNLRNIGYSVEYTHPNLLFISWRAHDERYRAVDSPWSQVLNTVHNKIHVEAESSIPKVWYGTLKEKEKDKDKDIDIVKRKTVLKKTDEYKPILEIHAKPTQTTTVTRLPGQLTEKHVSFV